MTISVGYGHKREMTGAGFFTYFATLEAAISRWNSPRFSRDLGYLHDLEGYSYEEPWPRHFELIRLFYDKNESRNEDKVIKSFHARKPIE
jgi:hypothetical protein